MRITFRVPATVQTDDFPSVSKFIEEYPDADVLSVEGEDLRGTCTKCNSVMLIGESYAIIENKLFCTECISIQ